jgi:hypothetical protein
MKNKYIENPEVLWNLFKEYEQHVADNPIKITDYVGKDAKEVTRKRIRPLTMEGFEYFCYEKGKISDLKHYFANTDKSYTNYQEVCERIKTVIRDNQISGGMAQIFSASITQRLNNLKETTVNINQAGKDLEESYED